MNSFDKCSICVLLILILHGVSRAHDLEKPEVGGEGWIIVGTKSDKMDIHLLAEVDTGADRTSIDAVCADVAKLDEQLSKGDEFEFWLVTEREKVEGVKPAKWRVLNKKKVTGTYEGTKTINGKLRTLVRLWIKVPELEVIQLIVSLNDRNKRERVLLGEDWTDGKLIDTTKTIGRPPTEKTIVD